MQVTVSMVATVEVKNLTDANLFTATELALPVAVLSSFTTEVAVYAAAKAAQTDFNAIVRMVAELSNGTAKLGALKDIERSREKVSCDYAGDWRRIHDVLRGTILVNRINDIRKVVRHLRRVLTLAGWVICKRPKNKFAVPADGGYRDLNLSVKGPNGVIAEIQINLTSMTAAKKQAHGDYEIVRSIMGLAHRENRCMTTAELDQVESATNRMQAIYQAAWMESGAL